MNASLLLHMQCGQKNKVEKQLKNFRDVLLNFCVHKKLSFCRSMSSAGCTGTGSGGLGGLPRGDRTRVKEEEVSEKSVTVLCCQSYRLPTVVPCSLP